MRPPVSFDGCAERRIHRDKPGVAPCSLRGRFRSATVAGFQSPDRQRESRLRALAQLRPERLVTGDMFKTSLEQPEKLLRPSVSLAAPDAMCSLRNDMMVTALKSGINVMRTRPEARPRFSTATRTRAALRCLSCRLPRRPACSPPIHVSSTSTSPLRRGSLAAFTIARRSLCSIIHAVLVAGQAQ